MKITMLLALIIAQAVFSDFREFTFTRTFCEETLSSGTYLRKGLVVDHNFNDLYFNTIGYSFKLNLDTKEVFQLPNIVDAWDPAVNLEGREVFVGGGQGIYKFNPASNITTFVGAGDREIHSMFYKDVLYFSTHYPGVKLYTLRNGEYKLFEDLKDTTVYDFVIDNNDTMFFNNFTGVYKQQKGSNHAVRILEVGWPSVTTMAVDLSGELYVVKGGNINYFNKKSLQLEKLLDTHLISDVTFDKYGHLIYADNRNIYRLTPKNNTHSC